MRRLLTAVTAAAVLSGVLPLASAAASAPSSGVARAGTAVADRSSGPTACERKRRVRVPGAELQRVSPCLPDLTTYGLLGGSYAPTGNPRNGVYTDVADFAGLHAEGTVNPRGVPGVQVDGYFPDTSTTNTTHGWDHDSQFVVRLPDDWNGRLVVAGAPGVRKQYSSDFLISDAVLAQGFAYASIDKGNTGALFFTDGRRPGDAVREWHARVTQVAQAAQRVVQQVYGQRPERTYMTGISNGGYLTRWQLENRPEVFDGGVDWEGTLFEQDNLLEYLPQALRAYPAFRDAPEGSAAKETARRAMYAAGFEPGSEFLWPLHHSVYWDLTARIYREELDPDLDGALLAGITATCPLAGLPGCTPLDTAYDPAQRQRQLRQAMRGITLTGRLGRPMLSLHGTLDTLLPIDLHGDRYAELVVDAGRARLHRYYVVERGQHVDGFFDRTDLGVPKGAVRPMLPCYREAFDAMVAWVERGVRPPASGTVKGATGDVVNECAL